MNIQEAVKAALECDGMIHRESITFGGREIHGVIKPTNTYDTCILMVLEEGIVKRSCRCWNPTAEDLIANDWEIVKE